MSNASSAPRGATILAVAVLGLLLAAVAAAYTVIAGVIFEPLPFRGSGQLVKLEGSLRDASGVQPFPTSLTDFADWRRQSTAFAGMSVYGQLGFNLEQGAQSRHLTGDLVNAGYFELLGVRPQVGRFFTAAEDARPLTTWVVVLSDELWRSAFHGDPGVVGRAVRLNHQRYTVVGVAQHGFRGLTDDAQLWVPSMLPPIPDYLQVRRERWVDGVARLAPGVSRAQAQRQLDGITAALARAYPNMDQGIGVTVKPLGEALLPPVRRPLLRLAAAAKLLLLLAAANAALLAGRRSVAAAAGLGLAAAALGLLLAAWATPALVEASGAALPGWIARAPGPLVVLAVAALGVFVTIVALAVLAPRAPQDAAAPGAAGAVRRKGLGPRLLVGAEVLLALGLVAAAVWQAHAYRRLLHTDLGFHADNVLSFRMDLKGTGYMDNGVVSDLLRRRYLPRIAAVPGVRQAAISNPTIPTDGAVGGYMTIDDHASSTPDGTYIAIWHSVSPAYFATMGIPLLAGRPFTDADTDTDTVIVSKAFADQQWPGKNPLGHRIKQDARAVVKEPWMTVVGVAAPARHVGLQTDDQPGPDIYMSVYQFPLRLPLTINFLIQPRPGIEPHALQPALHQAMAAIDPEIPDYDYATFADRLAKQTQDTRFQVVLAALFAALALVLAATGLVALRLRRRPAG